MIFEFSINKTIFLTSNYQINNVFQADKERDERRRALGGPDYDIRNGNLFEPTLSSPSEENSHSEDFHNFAPYGLEPGVLVGEGESSPTSLGEAGSQDNFEYDPDTTDTSPDNHSATLKLKLKEVSRITFVLASTQ